MSELAVKKKICVHLTSLGCPKNFVDTEIIAGSLLKNGIGISSDPKSVDVMLINTCAFLESARKETEGHVREALKWRSAKRDRKVVLCGCINQWDQNGSKLDFLREVDLRIGLDDIETTAEKILSSFFKKPITTSIAPCPSYLPNYLTPRLQLTPRHYAYVKIAEGCSNCCTYCLIPSIRGHFRSRDVNDIVSEIDGLLKNGCREIILIAQDSGNYGSDLTTNSDKIAGLIRKIDQLNSPNDFWLRLMYCHPRHFDDELVAVFENSKHLLPYVDLPLQHISEKILGMMNRGVGSIQTKKLLNRLRGLNRSIAIRTTFISGFPGETEDDFNEMLEFVKEEKFDRLGVFAYSPEHGTPAESFKYRIPNEIAEKRRDTILKTQMNISMLRNKDLIGENIPVIIDSFLSNGKYRARTKNDAPDIDNQVMLSSERKLAAGDFVTAKIKSASAYTINAKAIF